MLRVGLTGGIGSGKSTVARRLVERGALLVDSDVLAREVVAAGTDGLAEVVASFGATVLTPDRELDRPALASVVFGDPAARERLNAIVHPRVRRASDALVAAAPAGAVVVQDVPLLVEGGMAPYFPLVVVVHVEVDERVRRLVGRGMSEPDARARIAAQADDSARRAVADVWLDNTGSPEQLTRAVDDLWCARLVPFEENLRLRRTVRSVPHLVEPDPDWPAAAARSAARVAVAAGEWGRGVAHIGSTAVPGLPAQDVIDLQLGVDADVDAGHLREALSDAGFPHDRNRPEPADAGPWPPWCHRGADPGRRVQLHVRDVGSPAWRVALLARDWLRADPVAHAEYLDRTRRAGAAGGDPSRYVGDIGSWLDAASHRAERWAVSSGWAPSLD